MYAKCRDSCSLKANVNHISQETKQIGDYGRTGIQALISYHIDGDAHALYNISVKLPFDLIRIVQSDIFNKQPS